MYVRSGISTATALVADWFHLLFFSSSPGYIAGVTNLIFESSKSWDLLCDVSTGRMVVSKDISTNYPYSPPPSLAPQLVNRTGTLKAESSIGSEEEFGKLRSDFSGSKSENYDNMFMEDVRFPPPFNFLRSSIFISLGLDHIGHFIPFRRESRQGSIHGLRLAIRSAGRTLRRGS